MCQHSRSEIYINPLQLRFRLRAQRRLDLDRAHHRRLEKTVAILSAKISQLIKSHNKLVNFLKVPEESVSDSDNELPASDWTLDPNEQSQILVPRAGLEHCQLDFDSEPESDLHPYIMSVESQIAHAIYSGYEDEKE